MRTILTFFLGLRAIMLIGSAGAIVGALLMFLQGGYYLLEAWHIALATGEGFEHASERQVTVPVLEAVDAFLFGLVLVIFAYGIAIGFVFALPEGYGQRLPAWMKVDGIGQLKASLSEVVIVVLIVMFARVVVESGGAFTYEMLVLPASILMIAIALRMIDLGSGHAPNGNGDGHGKASVVPAKKETSENGPH
ncbi:YqhA family protein [Methyloligella solikamskensis]|uniref:YqhA family protein n=1 Tax=Methyloligella solikamskensis TaxID=1177756 RepID=A0ABW3JB90_9HYPH